MQRSPLRTTCRLIRIRVLHPAREFHERAGVAYGGGGRLCLLIGFGIAVLASFLITYLQLEHPCTLGLPGVWGIGLARSANGPAATFLDSPAPKSAGCHTGNERAAPAVRAPQDGQHHHLAVTAGPVLSCLHSPPSYRASFSADPFIIRGKRDTVQRGPPRTDCPTVDSSERASIAAPAYCADPQYEREGTWFMFFEALTTATGKGDIGVASSPNPLQQEWTFEGIVLAETFHLSFPFVFFHQGEYFMVPESWMAQGIRLYRATKFPLEWQFVRELVSGFGFVDTSPLLYEGRWYLWTAYTRQEIELYVSDTADLLNATFSRHPMSPIYRLDEARRRPAGRPILHPDGLITRFVQDGCEAYGHHVRIMRVFELSPTVYREAEVGQILPRRDVHYLSQRVHHLDAHWVGPDAVPLRQIPSSAAVSAAFVGHVDDVAAHDRQVADAGFWLAAIDGGFEVRDLAVTLPLTWGLLSLIWAVGFASVVAWTVDWSSSSDDRSPAQRSGGWALLSQSCEDSGAARGAVDSAYDVDDYTDDVDDDLHIQRSGRGRTSAATRQAGPGRRRSGGGRRQGPVDRHRPCQLPGLPRCDQPHRLPDRPARLPHRGVVSLCPARRSRGAAV